MTGLSLRTPCFSFRSFLFGIGQSGTKVFFFVSQFFGFPPVSIILPNAPYSFNHVSTTPYNFGKVFYLPTDAQ